MNSLFRFVVLPTRTSLKINLRHFTSLPFRSGVGSALFFYSTFLKGSCNTNDCSLQNQQIMTNFTIKRSFMTSSIQAKDSFYEMKRQSRTASGLQTFFDKFSLFRILFHVLY
jgi:hypothetical protein